MKYNYDKSVLKTLSVGPFLAIDKTREEAIENAPDTMPKAEYSVNELASSLHPSMQNCIIKKVIKRKDAKSYILVADPDSNTKTLAYFRAGQYVAVKLQIGESYVSRPYSICSSPKDALGDEERSYMLTIKAVKDGFVSNYILDNWKVNDKVKITGPLGDRFYYERIRDAKNVLAIAGGSGITPFYAMAKAIEDGVEDFNLTILYGSKTLDDILLKKELKDIKSKKVKVINILSDEERKGYEHGFINLDIIKKYAFDEDYSIFMCGPKAMYDFVSKEIRPLNLKPRRIRIEAYEHKNVVYDPKYPTKKIYDTYKLTVKLRDSERVIDCKANETLLVALERAGIKAPSRCRSGECGWCHSLLVKGKVFIPEEKDYRRLADKKFGYIHPCVSYPLSDITLEVKAK